MRPMSSELLLQRLLQHISKLQFVEADKLLRNEWTTTARSGEDAESATDLLSLLIQLVNAESQYFMFSYLTSKFSFRKENNLRDIYTQMKSEFGKIGSDEQKVRQQNVAEMASKFAQFAGIRACLVEFYSLLPTKEWRAFESAGFCELMDELGQMSDDDALFEPYRRELRTLQLFQEGHRAIQQCNVFDALILLGRARALLDEWFHSLDPQAASTHPSKSSSGASAFLLSSLGFRRRPSFSRLGLLQFLAQFHHLLVAKLSLYFHDTLTVHAPNGEMRQAFTATNSFLQLFQSFSRKTNAHTVCILLNRIDQDGPFQGFGYHFAMTDEEEPLTPQGKKEDEAMMKLKTENDEIKTTAEGSGGAEKVARYKQSGLSEKYPALLFLPSERRATIALGAGSEYATICAFVQEGCGGGAVGGSSSNDKLSESGKIRYLYDRNKDQTFFTVCIEANLHLVVTFERRVQERESNVHAFFNDALNGLRGTKLFQHEIRTFGK